MPREDTPPNLSNTTFGYISRGKNLCGKESQGEGETESGYHREELRHLIQGVNSGTLLTPVK